MSEKTPQIPDEALEALPMFPLPGAVFFPGAVLPLHIFEPRYRDMVEHCLATHSALAVALLEPGYEARYFARPRVFAVMGAGMIVAHNQLDDGRWNIVVRGTDRVRVVAEHPARRPFREICAERLRSSTGLEQGDTSEIRDRAETLRALALTLAAAAPQLEVPLNQIALHARSPATLADHLAAAFVTDAEVRQSLLEQLDVTARLEQVTNALGDLLLKLSTRSDDRSVN